MKCQSIYHPELHPELLEDQLKKKSWSIGGESTQSCTSKRENNIILFFFLFPGYALDPSIDNPEVATKYIGSVEEAEKNQGK